ncbi:hypothetical protein [Micromonospora echinofusca]|uniref:Protein kinase domain-containing protein n=1 Tax=Micromonospora echinofusca TaxID=47858 RepID=A0ABS3VV82_MICEH|nr:hypothetical protein [Micromonospora echinofusca]MBO4208462.1 hypothetical protein [Micromonospora echinofusca]
MSTGNGPLSGVDVVDIGQITRSSGDGHVGGGSTLHRCTYRGGRYLFKRYRPEHLREVDSAALGRQVAWRHGLPEADRARLDAVASWPLRRVRDRAGGLGGILIPEANAAFSHRGRWGERRPHTLADLIRLTAGGTVRAGAPVDVKQVALGRVARTILWLHSCGVVVNDVQAENILCRRDGSAVYLVDCDAMLGPWGQVCPPQAPDYMRIVVPGADRPDQVTDLARLAWVAVWLLLDDFSVVGLRQERLAGLIGADAAETLMAAATAGRGGPPAGSWHRLAAQWAPEHLPARSGPVSGVVVGRAPRPASPVPTRRPVNWVPPRYRRPLVRHWDTDPVPVPEPDVPPRRRRSRLVLSAAALLGGLALLDLLWEVIR